MKYICAAWCAAALVGNSLESFRILQAASYRPQRGYWRVVFTFYYLALLLVQGFSLAWELFAIKPLLCGIYTLVALPWVFVPRKSPLKFTKRIWRMVTVEFLLLFVACLFALNWWVAALPIFVLLAWLICLPVECIINHKYLKAAQRKLQQSNVTVVAITGSFGKTSAKDMLSALLKDCVSPLGSCNTPLGIAKFINGADLSAAKFLVLEFGARKRGDIAELCCLFRPKFGLVTGVCEQHLSTFKTFANIVATKRELVEGLPPEGICVLGDESVFCYWGCGVCKTVKNSVVKISNCSVGAGGLNFTVRRKDYIAEVHLPQIPVHSAQTFANCLLLCEKLGQAPSVTVERAKFVQQTPHRMSISHNGKFFIIDDSYNASIKGVESCCDALQRLEGSKVGILQGIVEGGKRSRELNEQCGRLLGEVCDVVVVVGKNSQWLLRGLRQTSAKIICAKTVQAAVQAAKPYLQRNTFLLFQNDLPDVVNV